MNISSLLLLFEILSTIWLIYWFVLVFELRKNFEVAFISLNGLSKIMGVSMIRLNSSMIVEVFAPWINKSENFFCISSAKDTSS